MSFIFDTSLTGLIIRTDEVLKFLSMSRPEYVSVYYKICDLFETIYKNLHVQTPFIYKCECIIAGIIFITGHSV